MHDGEIDLALLRAWQAGDRSAGRRLYDRHAHAVARFFANKVAAGNDELIQQTFLRVVEGRDRIRSGVAFRGFVLGVARNVLYEHIRKLARKREVDFELESIAGIDPSPSTLLGRAHEQRLLLEGLRRLPIEQQYLLELHYFEGLGPGELATMLETTASAIRGKLARARKGLREVLEAIADSPELLASTLGGLEGWAADVREQLQQERER